MKSRRECARPRRFQNSESCTAGPSDGTQGLASPGSSGTSAPVAADDSSMLETPVAVSLTLVRAFHYAESQPMPNPTTTVQESRPGAQQIVGVQLPLF